MTKITAWEYKVIRVNPTQGWRTDLDTFGEDGWEAFSARHTVCGEYEIFLKRPLENKNP